MNVGDRRKRGSLGNNQVRESRVEEESTAVQKGFFLSAPIKSRGGGQGCQRSSCGNQPRRLGVREREAPALQPPLGGFGGELSRIVFLYAGVTVAILD